MTVFGEGRGSFMAVNVDTSKGRGVVVSVPGGDPVGSSSLVTSFSMSQAEKYSVSECLNGGIFMYAFGHDPQRSQFSLGVTSFLGGCDGYSGEDLSNALTVYRNGRVSQSKALSTLSVGSGAFSGYLVGQGIDVVSQELGIVSATYTFVALDVQGGK